MEQARAFMLQTFGFDNFINGNQQLAVESILEAKKKNYLINMVTQGGKSLCYQLPGNLIFLAILQNY